MGVERGEEGRVDRMSPRVSSLCRAFFSVFSVFVWCVALVFRSTYQCRMARCISFASTIVYVMRRDLLDGFRA